MSENGIHRPVTAVRGVGEKQAEYLQELGIVTVEDLMEYFPQRYEDYRIRRIQDVEDGEKITVKGVIYGPPQVRFYGKNKSRLTVKVIIDNVNITAVWFNRHFLKKQLQPGKEIMLTGKWDRQRLQLTVQEHHLATSSRKALEETIQPVYYGGGQLSSSQIRTWISRAFDQFFDEIKENIPHEILDRYRLMPRAQALKEMHFPADSEMGRQARRRLSFEELFLFQLKMQTYRYVNKRQTSGTAQEIPLEEIRSFIGSLPFPLTNAQNRVIDEILKDMASPFSMYRLLQGDVGSGKTVVAAIALLATVKAGFQGAMMVPTEILAEQHVQSMKEWLNPLGIEVALLSGSATTRQRRDILGQLQMGLIDVVIGTHALIQEDVYFHRLGLVITDEQHRFGVQQRRILREKGLNPDVLFMTATPIPRTLAITAFGDMDLSTLDELPAGRKPVETYWVRHDKMERVMRFTAKEICQGRQAYVICPLIEESEKLDVQNAIDVHAQFANFFPPEQVGLLHGRMPAAEKDEVMKRFSENQIKILVSTTVVEVGVNVPNATLMIIYDAERFGLAQLHQLRGRVGRGEHQAYCILIADPKTEVGKERMTVMTETNDGFEVSRRDLELRGPGDFFGTKQSGIPDFKVADITRDYKALEVARDEASRIVNDPRFWDGDQWTVLREYLRRQGIFDRQIWD